MNVISFGDDICVYDYAYGKFYLFYTEDVFNHNTSQILTFIHETMVEDFGHVV